MKFFNFDSNKKYTRLEFAKNQLKKDERLKNTLKNISIMATTISGYQIASLGFPEAPKYVFNFFGVNAEINIIATLAIPLSFWAAKALEDAQHSNAQKLSELWGKNYRQEVKQRELTGALAGFVGSLSLNIITFTMGVYFTVYGAVALMNKFRADPAKPYKLELTQNESLIKKYYGELTPEGQTLYIKRLKSLGADNEKAKQKIMNQLQEAKRAYNEAITKAKAIRDNELRTKVRFGTKWESEDRGWISKKYSRAVNIAKREYLARKQELLNALNTLPKQINIVYLIKQHKEEVLHDIEELQAKNKKLTEKINSFKQKAIKGISWGASFAIALGFYALTFLFNVAEQRSRDKVQRLLKLESKREDDFNIEDYTNFNVNTSSTQEPKEQEPNFTFSESKEPKKDNFDFEPTVNYKSDKGDFDPFAKFEDKLSQIVK